MSSSRSPSISHLLPARPACRSPRSVTRMPPRRQQPVLWVSSLSAFELGKTIRGGIPVCWPWFGTHPTDPSKPFHGFVRTAMWQVRGTSVGQGDATEVRLGLTESDDSLALWPYAFDLEMVVTVGAQLRVELIARNPGD